MLPYWILFLGWAAGAFQYQRALNRPNVDARLMIAGLMTALMIGLRYRVGGDWGNYGRMFGDIALLNFEQAVRQSDPAYGFLNWLAASLGLGVVTVNLICGAIFTWGLIRFAMRQPNPWLTVLVGVPYFIIVVGMGYTRQATAIGIILAGLAVATEKRVLRLIGYVFVATLFHKSAVLALAPIGAALLRKSPIAAVGAGVAFMGLYFAFLSSSADELIANYAQGTYDSSGAAIRVAMDVLAAAAFFLYRKRMGLSPFQHAYWFTCSILSIVSALALAALPSSAGVDRLALFLIPLQFAVLPRLPYVFGSGGRKNAQVTIAVLAYSAAVQAIWLNMADNAYLWVPYRTAVFAE